MNLTRRLLPLAAAATAAAIGAGCSNDSAEKAETRTRAVSTTLTSSSARDTAAARVEKAIHRPRPLKGSPGSLPPRLSQPSQASPSLRGAPGPPPASALGTAPSPPR